MRPDTLRPAFVSRRQRRRCDLARHRPRMPILARPSPDDEVRTSDLVLAVAGIGLLGGFCLVLTSGLLAGAPIP